VSRAADGAPTASDTIVLAARSLPRGGGGLVPRESFRCPGWSAPTAYSLSYQESELEHEKQSPQQGQQTNPQQNPNSPDRKGDNDDDRKSRKDGDQGNVGHDTDGDGKVVKPGQTPNQSGGKGLPENK
jgi:hypothetical protein